MTLAPRRTTIAVLLGSAVLLFLLQAVPLFSFRWVEDESFYSCTGYNLASKGEVVTSFYAPNKPQHYDTRPLAMPLTLATAFRVMGTSVRSARLPELLACLAAIPLVMWLGFRMGGIDAGIIAVFLLSVDNALFLAARTVRPEAFVAACGLVAVALYLSSKESKSLGLAALSGLFLGLALNYHVNGYGIAASIGILLLKDFGFTIWRQKRAWTLVLVTVATLVPFVVWLTGNPTHMAAFSELYARGNPGKYPWGFMLHLEAIRYSDLLGFGNQRIALIPYPIPLRLHIVLLVVFSFVVLAWKRRAAFWTLLALVVPSMVLWTRESNSSARFFVIIAPYFAVAIGLAFTALETRTWKRVFLAWCAVAFLTQTIGNGLLLMRSRNADYVSVTRQLRTIIPDGTTVFGMDTFYLALYDHPYYAGHYTDFDYAINTLGVRYLILNDRVMLYGAGYGDDEYKYVRDRANDFVKTQADLVGQVPSAFYGDLQIYRVKPSGSVLGAAR